MLETKLKKWQGKKVELSYIYKDNEGNIYNPDEEIEKLKAEILEQGFTFTETRETIEVDGTGQFFWKPRTKPMVGIFNARSTKYELLEGDEVVVSGQYPTKQNIVDYGEDFFIKQGRGYEMVYRLI